MVFSVIPVFAVISMPVFAMTDANVHSDAAVCVASAGSTTQPQLTRAYDIDVNR